MQKTIHIIIYNYLPLFKDGRVNRTKYFVDYLLQKGGFKVEVYTLGVTDKRIIISQNYIINQIPSNVVSLSSKPKDKSNNWFFSNLVKLINQIIIFDVFLFKFLEVKKVVNSNFRKNDIIYISVPWFSALLNLSWISSKTNTIIDYRDVLIDNPIFSRNFFQNGLHYFLEFILLFKASEILVTTESAKNKISHKKITIVRNGISRQELPLINLSKSANIEGVIDKDLIYFGNLGNRRNAIKLFSLLNKESVDYEVYGSIDSSHSSIVKSRYKGFVDIDKLYNLIFSFKSVLVVILPEEDSKNAIPGKLYQIIATGIPIVLYSNIDSASKAYLESIQYEFLFIDCLNTTKDIKTKINSLTKNLSFNNLVIREDEYAKIRTIK
jgi:hypothetical protein